MTWCTGWGNALGNTGSGFYGGWWTVGLIVNMLFFLLIVIGSILLIRWLVKSFRQPVSAGATTPRSLEILKERYAKGEISKEQFRKMRKEVGG